ncbi:50S ribosomal protein L25/general stress protein Ctc [Actinobacteria bacterium YIM 96077]|uniref:Large ribosomal subunit protein bL25 n=1 Tax=Phytoactinopolyspora halophila TaxID=1981511 RepID=A0A329QGZ2_9ACTN|nr:50S ribosomal protein L25/general stress protein Ctc [Phytoactinopolyspora halophila]AYY14453.1 50S ribosomal protein L25/general stress protein Ctc [Actinobacteria bacterium YIM 96077]RAW11446.1 50S ribosomal protein L25 [Phytoactinopolyspora halophila]
MSDIKIAAELRTEFGKGAARRLRRADKVPAVLYGHGTDPVHLALPGHDTMMALKNPNALLTLDIAGGGNELALPKHVQRDPLKGFIEHVDLLLVRRGEKVTVDIPVVIDGEPISGSMVTQENTSIAIEADATRLPESVHVSVDGLDIGSQIHAGDLEMPRGTTLISDPELLVVNVSAMAMAPEPEEEEGAEAAEEQPAAAESEAEGESGSDES